MTSLLRTLLAPTSARSSVISIDDLAAMIARFPFSLNQTLTNGREEIGGDYLGLVAGAYRSNGAIFALINRRAQLFSGVRFRWQQLRNGQPGDFFGTPDLALLEYPEPGKTTADMIMEAVVDLDLAGNWFAARRPGRIMRLRPDWVTIVLGSRNVGADPRVSDIDVEVAGYIYQEGGRYGSLDPVALGRDEVAHVTLVRDPMARYRGMSWLTPVIREIQADSAATLHKLKFFENGATPNMVVTLDKGLDIKKAREFIELFEQEHKGLDNAYRTVFLGGGADVEVVGKDLQQIDFKATQGAGQTILTAAAGLHPTILPFSEGLQGSSLNSGNFGAARRLVADGTLHPGWGNFAGSLQTILPPPAGARLWYDISSIPFLAEDVKDAAEVLNLQAQAVRTLTDGGYTPESVVDAVSAKDVRRLVSTGFTSVQLQALPEPGAEPSPPQLPPGRAMALLGPGEVRCTGCDRLLAELTAAPYRFTCRYCKTVVASEDAPPPSRDLEDVQRQQGELLAALAGRSTSVTIESGAVQVSSPITVEPMSEGAVRVDVHAPPVSIERGAVQVDVTTPPVTIAEGAVRVDVSTPDVRIEEGAIRLDSPVTVTVPERSVEPAQVTIAEGAVRVVEHPLTRSVFDRDPETGQITGTHEELLD